MGLKSLYSKKRRLAREIALYVLYQIDQGVPKEELLQWQWLKDFLTTGIKENDFTDDMLKLIQEIVGEDNIEKILEDREIMDFAEDLIVGTLKHQEMIDQIISKFLTKDWELERLSPIDRNILRFSIYSLLFRSDIPPAVVMDEAVEIAKEYGGFKESYKLINGILDRVKKEYLEVNKKN